MVKKATRKLIGKGLAAMGHHPILTAGGLATAYLVLTSNRARKERTKMMLQNFKGEKGQE